MALAHVLHIRAVTFLGRSGTVATSAPGRLPSKRASGWVEGSTCAGAWMGVAHFAPRHDRPVIGHEHSGPGTPQVGAQETIVWLNK